MRRKSPKPAHLLLIALSLAFLSLMSGPHSNVQPDVLLLQSQAEADRKSAGCITCHTATDSATMHSTGTVRLGCTDCHGGNAEIRLTADAPKDSPQYDQAKARGPSPTAESGQCPQLRQSDASLHPVAQRRLELHSLRQPRRPARRRKNLRHQRLPHR